MPEKADVELVIRLMDDLIAETIKARNMIPESFNQSRLELNEAIRLFTKRKGLAQLVLQQMFEGPPPSVSFRLGHKHFGKS